MNHLFGIKLWKFVTYWIIKVYKVCHMILTSVHLTATMSSSWQKENLVRSLDRVSSSPAPEVGESAFIGKVQPWLHTIFPGSGVDPDACGVVVGVTWEYGFGTMMGFPDLSVTGWPYTSVFGTSTGLWKASVSGCGVGWLPFEGTGTRKVLPWLSVIGKWL